MAGPTADPPGAAATSPTVPRNRQVNAPIDAMKTHLRHMAETMSGETPTVKPRSLRVERFSARPLTAPVRAEAFEVELARSELTRTVSPDRSILDVIEEAGVGVLSSCAEGTCGTCETAVLDGLPDHRDSVLTEDERRARDCMMICISRSCTARLALDL